MKKIAVLIFKLFLLPFKLLPLKNYVIFESAPIYSDNTKALYEHLEKKGFLENKKVFWFLIDRDFELYTDSDLFESKRQDFEIIVFDKSSFLKRIISEFRANYFLSRTKYYFFSHHNFYRFRPKEGQLFINLTHGISLKNTVGMYSSHHNFSKILVLSEFTKTLRERTFGGGREKMIALGFPRNDYLLSKVDDNLIRFGQHTFSKNLVWLPTFRRQKDTGRNDTNAETNSDLPILKSFNDLEKLNIKLRELDILLIIKPHPAQDLEYFKINALSNIIVIEDKYLIEEDIHLYELLAISDGLITDYSSVYVDYLLTNKMIGFTVDDIQKYKQKRGFMVENPEDYMPGHKIDDFRSFHQFIKDVANDRDIYKEQRQKIQKIFHNNVDNKSTLRLVEYIMELEDKSNE